MRSATPRRTESLAIDLHAGDCVEVMQGFATGFVHLIVTSPPYNCGKDYEVVGDALPWDAYWEWTARWLAEAYRVLVPGGRLVVNLTWWMMKKPRRDVPYQFKQVALGLGFCFLDKVIWIKGDGSNTHTSGGWGGRGSGWGTYLSPSGPSIRCASEPILVFAKSSRGRRIISGEGRGKCVRGDMTKDEWMAWTKDAWFIRGTSDPDHPAVFPAEVPHRFIKLYTYPGEIVLDPFCGIGTTILAAKNLGRQGIGIDANPRYIEIAKRRLENLLTTAA
jgi:DNA modification methylase